MTIYGTKNNGKPVSCLSFRMGGKQARRFFKRKIDAESTLRGLRVQPRDVGDVWLALSASERHQIVQVSEEVRKAGKTLREVWKDFKAAKPVAECTLGVAVDEVLAVKERPGRSPNYVHRMRWYLTAFALGREGEHPSLPWQPFDSLSLRQVAWYWRDQLPGDTRAKK